MLYLEMYKNVAILVIALISTFVLVDSFSCRSEVTQVKLYNLNIVIFVPQPDDDFNPAFDKGYSIIPAVEMAIEQINKRTDILPYFHLNLNVKDAGCDKASKTAIETVSVLRDLVKSRNGPVAIIGPACSEDSVFVANTFNRVYNLTVLYSGTTPYLSEHAEDTPNAFGMVSSAAVLTDTLIRIAIEEKWNWENIAVLYDNSREHYQDVYDALVRGLNGSQTSWLHSTDCIVTNSTCRHCCKKHSNCSCTFRQGAITSISLSCRTVYSELCLSSQTVHLHREVIRGFFWRPKERVFVHTRQ